MLRLDNINISKKIVIPTIVSLFVIATVTVVASWQLHCVSTEAEVIISKRDYAAILIARSLREMYQAAYYDFIIADSDTDSPAGRMASEGFEKALKGSESLLEEAAELRPDQATDLLALRDKIAAEEPKLKAAFAIGSALPGLQHAETFKPADLSQLARIGSLLNEVTLPLDAISTDAVTLNNRVITANQVHAAEMKARSTTTFIFLLAGGLGTALLIGAFAFWLSSAKIAKPLGAVTGRLKSLAAGDLNILVEGREREDEVGDLARALQVFKDNAAEKAHLETEARQARAAADAERLRQEEIKAEEVRQQAHVVETIADGLDMLAQGRLTFRINEAFPSEYERLRADFNSAMERLLATVSVVADNTLTIRSGTKEISTASDDLARRTEQQAANLEETVAAFRQINETVKSTSEGAAHAHRLIFDAKQQADASGLIMRETVGAMTNIDKSSSQMGQIIGVIDEIAFQTNLLALNAGVEAARAGEAGRGFAVVASEVRALAQRSAEAAKEIKTLINASSQQITQGVDLVGRTGAALDHIVQSIGEITDIVAQIAMDAQEQAAGLAEIDSALSQMDRNTQQNAAIVEESTAASHGLARESDELAKVIEGFDVGKRNIAAKPQPTARPAAGTPPAAAAVRKVVGGRPKPAANPRDAWEQF
jgi:methyl-accepting chemotaxis protein